MATLAFVAHKNGEEKATFRRTAPVRKRCNRCPAQSTLPYGRGSVFRKWSLNSPS